MARFIPSTTAVATALALCAGLGGPVRAADAVTVTTGDLSRFSDVGQSGIDRERTVEALARHLRSLGERGLPPGQTLEVKLLDVDLAGRIDPSSSISEVRVDRGRADGPRIKLHYTLYAGTTVLRSAEETLTDLDYLNRGPTVRSPGPLRFEKRLLDEWFAERITAPAKAAAIPSPAG